MSYDDSGCARSYIGIQIHSTLMAGLPSRVKYVSDYLGVSVPPCGEFAETVANPTARSVPWLDKVGTGPLTLHDEIKLFTAYLSPTPYEESLRADLVRRFTALVETFTFREGPGSVVTTVTAKPVGSYITHLYTPQSDIDMVLTRHVQTETNSDSRGEWEFDFEGNSLLQSAIFEWMDAAEEEATFEDEGFRFRIDGSPESTLFSVMYELRCTRWARSIEDVLHASVPLLRIVDRETGLRIDLTVSDGHGEEATEAVARALKATVGTPLFPDSNPKNQDEQDEEELKRSLIAIVKMFLSIRRCGTTYTGGLNSYVVVWMVVAFVQLEWGKIKNSKSTPAPFGASANYYGSSPKVISAGQDVRDSLANMVGRLGIDSSCESENSYRTVPTRNTTPSTRDTSTNKMDFGHALLAFFKFYGQDFDYTNLAIRFDDVNGNIKARYQRKLGCSSQPFLLSIRDPINMNDMGSKVYAIKHIKESFKEAYKVLDNLLSCPVRSNGRGILGQVLGGDWSHFQRCREKIIQAHASTPNVE